MLSALISRARARVQNKPNLVELEAAGLRIGRGVDIGRGTLIDPFHCWLVDIGDGVTISAEVAILAHDASTKKLIGYTRVARTRIGRDAYLGARAVILPGVTIGERAIIGAGSVVRHDVPAGAVAAGNPARVVGDAAEFGARHRERLGRRPTYESRDWTWTGGISWAQRERMRADLESGEGYAP